MFKLNNEQ